MDHRVVSGCFFQFLLTVRDKGLGSTAHTTSSMNSLKGGKEGRRRSVPYCMTPSLCPIYSAFVFRHSPARKVMLHKILINIPQIFGNPLCQPDTRDSLKTDQIQPPPPPPPPPPRFSLLYNIYIYIYIYKRK